MKPTSFSSVISSPIGKIGIRTQDNYLCALKILPETFTTKLSGEKYSEHIAQELAQYFADPTHAFSVLLNDEGSPFQKRVWQALLKIPAGKTLTYGQLAKDLATSPRAIGQACRTNPIAIIIPCHRILGANHLGGYSGETAGDFMNIKKWLLEHERPKHAAEIS